MTALERAFKKQKIGLHLSSKGTRVEETAEGMTLWFEKGGETLSVTGDVILVATGRGAVVDDLGLEGIGVKSRRRRSRPTRTRRTSVPHIYAVGDVAGYWQLAHTRSARARSRPRTSPATTPR